MIVDLDERYIYRCSRCDAGFRKEQRCVDHEERCFERFDDGDLEACFYALEDDDWYT